MQHIQSLTARTWDSFSGTLYSVLGIFNPKSIFEYGPGMSTQIMSKYPSVELIDSVEHDKVWYEKWKWKMIDKVNLIYQPNLSLYPQTKGLLDIYDMVFIDGREREKCLFMAKSMIKSEGIVMLHDAERPSYKPMIDSYEYKFWTDEGHTVTLTDNNITAMKLEVL